MATRMYLVELTRKKVLVEATSQEAAIKAATAKMVRSCTIPTALETARLMTDSSIEVISPSVNRPEPPITQPNALQGDQSGDEGGVGSMGLREPDGENGGEQAWQAPPAKDD